MRSSRCFVYKTTRTPFLTAALALLFSILSYSAAQTVDDYRTRIQSVAPSAVLVANPDVTLLPTGREWVEHVRTDLLPYWTTPTALGTPIGNFPTFRADDGSVIDPKNPPPEVRNIAKSETWLLNRMGRQYTRAVSRQVYALCVAYHMTGDEQYLRYARAGIEYMRDNLIDEKGIPYSWIENGVPGPKNPKQRISQDLAYSMMGPAMYYYITRDKAVMDVLVRTEKFVFGNYRDGDALRWINEKLVDLEETNLPTQKELVAQLDQINGYMLLMTTILQGEDKERWRKEMVMLAETMKQDYYNAELNQFWGRIDCPEYKKLGMPHVDFGHTIKTLWMMYEIGERFGAADLRDFALSHMPRVFSEAYSPEYGTWIEKKLDGGKLGTDRIWWLHDELDQVAATLSLTDRSYIQYLIPAYRYWFFEFVDQQHKEVWHGLTGEPGKPAKPMFLKAHLWKSGFHSFEHALVGYITCQAVRGEPVRLYYAFEQDPAEGTVQPYFFAGKVIKIEKANQKVLGSFTKTTVDFSDIRP